MARSILVLVPSPLTTSLVWLQVAAALKAKGIETVVPSLEDDERSPVPFWRQHATSFQAALAPISPDRPLVLVGHSGAGPLLPALTEALGRSIAGYIFADAGLPEPGKSRLETMPDGLRQELGRHLSEGGRFPNWQDEDLRDVLPDAATRRAVIGALKPRDQRFYLERLPVFAAWPDAPCAYLLFSDGYADAAAEAEHRGWLCREIRGGHFHMLVDPTRVAAELMAMAAILERGD